MSSSIKIGLICGGPSEERGISLNSARSILDHLSSDSCEIFPIYVNQLLQFYPLSPAQLYSNTPSDFDFKIAQEKEALTPTELFSFLKEMDMVFPIIHGLFGEDGEIQYLLESMEIPFVGTKSQACQRAFDKFQAIEWMKQHDYKTIPSTLLLPHHDIKEQITLFWQTHQIKKAILKPTRQGSSLNVYSISSIEEACTIANTFLSNYPSEALLLQPFCLGKEFTICVLQNQHDNPIALLPIEVELDHSSGEILDCGEIFDYRHKYLPTNQVCYHCPPRFPESIISEIRQIAEELFNLFEMEDFARLDGWFLDDGSIVFSDFNPLSGMEQNSFIFQQAAKIGLSHQQLLYYIINHALKKYGRPPLPFFNHSQQKTTYSIDILLGGDTAEKQVSLMSGTNVWLKLRQFPHLQVTPYLLGPGKEVWKLPYAYTLYHTVEEILQLCHQLPEQIDKWQKQIRIIREQLGCNELTLEPEFTYSVSSQSLDSFIEEAQKRDSFIFLALHGGEGENGTIQSLLEKAGLPYNGSNSEVSRLCMDKHLTAQAISKLGIPNLSSLPQYLVHLNEALSILQNYDHLWNHLLDLFQADSFIIKPRSDGCSAGVARISSADDLKIYVEYASNRDPYIPVGTFANQEAIIEMPLSATEFIIEPFILIDKLEITEDQLLHHPRKGWLEMTIGITEAQGNYHAFNPSITVASSDVLSLEEKFQGGTGVNITPPPLELIDKQHLEQIKHSIEILASKLHLGNYARLDLFVNIHTHQIYIIEINSLPALTGSTVLFQQALAETPPIYPKEFLLSLIETKQHFKPF